MSGRKVTLDAISTGSVTTTGTAAYMAIVYSGNSEVLLTRALGLSQAVTIGNTWTLTAQDITIPDPTAGSMSTNIEDAGLAYITTNADIVHILSADPGLTYANVATYTLGNFSSPTFTGPAAG